MNRVKIAMCDPNYLNDGGKPLAWHFSTDHGDFLMVEESDGAFMSPSQLSVVGLFDPVRPSNTQWPPAASRHLRRGLVKLRKPRAKRRVISMTPMNLL
jgi:hypothetical protein